MAEEIAKTTENDAKETEDIDPIGHTWGEWVTDTAATCETKGTEIRYCQTSC